MGSYCSRFKVSGFGFRVSGLPAPRTPHPVPRNIRTDISIITVSFRGWDRLTKSLEALSSFTGSKIKTEVIVVDNKSDDDTIHFLESLFPDFRFIHNKVNGGFANGCNLGAENANGEFLLFLNPDTIASETSLEKLLDVAKQNPDYSILSCRQVNEKGKESIASGRFPEFWNMTGFQRALSNWINPPHLAPRTSHLEPEIIFPDWVSGSVILIKKDLFRKRGGFDEDFWMYFEDVDICKRIRINGGIIAFCRNITIEHNHGGSSRINLKTASLTKTEVHISRHLYISKHKKGFEKLIIQSFLVINNCISGAIMALLGLLFFFIPKLFARSLIFTRLIRYYAGSLSRQSWISPRSVNFK